MTIKIISNKLIDVHQDLSNISKTPISTDGGFGVVYRGKFKKKHHEEVECAIKYLKQEGDPNKNANELLKEISAQNSLKHPALLPLLGYYVPFCGIGKLTIVTPFMKNGSLRKVLALEKKSLAPVNWTETTRAINVLGIASGMRYMHQLEMIHRDLKTDNILLDEHYYPKICDFGCSKIFEEGLERIVNATILGTLPYMAPELLKGEGYNSKVDVFAYALVLYEIFALESAFNSSGKSPYVYFNSVMNGERPNLTDNPNFTPFFKKLINDCWEQDQKLRPSFDQIIDSLLTAYKKKEIFDPSTVDINEINNYIIDCIDHEFIYEE